MTNQCECARTHTRSVLVPRTGLELIQFENPSTQVVLQMHVVSRVVFRGSRNFVFRGQFLPSTKNYLLKSMVDTNPGEIIFSTSVFPVLVG
jgi:hypothetical protein